jgi:hypothetical protein
MFWSSGFWVWGVALLATVLFFGWYVSWRGPLSAEEVDRYVERMRTVHGDERNDLDTMRRFLEKDDGGEFVMLNLVKIVPGEVADPVTGEPSTGGKLLGKYTSVFMRALLARGGHPAIVSRKAGGYFDAWRVSPDPGWTVVGFMRYRSRRDMVELALDPRFASAHQFKFAATAETFSFPTKPVLRAYISPHLWVPLGFALLAALAQIAILISSARSVSAL